MQPDERSLRFGMFVMPIHDPAKPLAQCFDEDIELACQCEELGFDEFWIGEHHTSTYENIIMPELFIAKVLGMTKRIRMGAAPVCLQYHHPAHVAGRLAFLDQLSHGRLNVCFGPGAIPTDNELFGVDPKESGARVVEALNMILDIWTSDPPYHIEGKFWNIDLSKELDAEMGLGELQKPFQKPYPPVFVPCILRNSVGLSKAAARGFGAISHHMIGTEILADHWKMFEAGARSANLEPDFGKWHVTRNVFVAETTKEAQQLARGNSLGRCIEYIVELTRRGPGVDMWKRNPEMADADCNLDYFFDEAIIAGDPAEVTRQIKELRETIGPFGTLVLVAHDWDDKARWRNSLELFGNEVMPALTK